MRIAVLQMQAIPGDVGANLARIAAGAREARSQGADLLVAPELAIPGYGAGGDFLSLAETPDGSQSAELSKLSGDLGIAIVAGYAERDLAGGLPFNAAMLVQDGRVAGTYRKRQLYGDYEKRFFAPGDRCSDLFEIGGLKAGLAICYDIEFPETARELALAGADLLLVPTALPAGPHDAFFATRMVPVRAFENQVFVAYADPCGADAAFGYAGLSCICAPDGSDLARAPRESEALLIADIDAAAFADCRAANPYLRDLRAAGRAG